MAESTLSISLTINFSDGSTKVLEFNSDDPIMVGSGASAHVRIKGDDVSALHCMIKPKGDGRVAVLDLGSDEGTELNGKELSGEVDLNDGDTVTVGSGKITVHFGGDVLAPTVPIRRASGHGAANPEVTMPNNEHTVPLQAAPAKPSPKEEPKTEIVRDRKGAAGKPPKRQPVSGAGSGGSWGDKGAPAVSVTSMTPRIVHRESSSSGFKLKPGAPTAHRKMATTGGKAARLSPDLTPEEKPQNKGHVDVTALWGGTVIGVQRVNGAGTVTIGQALSNSFQITHQSIPSPVYTLVSLTPAGAVVHLATGMEAQVGGKTVTGKVTLDVGDKCLVRVGPLELVAQYSKRYTPIDLGLFQTLDFFYSKVFALALIAQLGLVLAFLLTPKFPSLDDDDLFKNQQDWTKLILTQQEKKKEKDLSGKKAAKAKQDEGVFGKKDKPKEDKLASKKGAPTVDKDKREEDRKIAMDALAQLGLKGPEGAVSNVFGPGGLGSGINNQLGGLKGASMGDAGGAGGLGSRGTGAGGGGTGLGIGGLGSGTGRGSGGSGNIDLGGRGKGMTRIVPGKIIYEGGLSREEIQRVISRVMSQIKYCYEKELNKDPNLEGKLVASWIISGSGDVQSANMAENTFGGASAQPVSQCVLRIIQRLKFPSPKGGGQVFVTYPFVFSSSGG